MSNIALIIGSVRRDRQGIKVGRWIEQKLKNRRHTVFFIDPLELDLPILDRMYKEMENPSEKIQKLRAMIKDADGYVAVTPEYNHGTSSAMKNTLDYFLEEYFFKPSAIVSYSIQNVFDENGKMIDENYERRVKKFLDEFEWYVDAFKNQRVKGTPY